MIDFNDSPVQVRRENLKQRIAKGEFETVLYFISARVGTIIKRIFRRNKQPPFLINITAIVIFTFLIDLLTSALFNEFSPNRNELIQVEVAVAVITIVGLAVFAEYLDHVYRTFKEDLIDNVDSVPDLVNLESWLENIGRVKPQLIFGIAYAFLVGLPVMLIAGFITGHFLGFGPIIFFVVMSVPAAIVLWYIALFLVLLVRMSTYQFNLHVADPSESVVIKCLSSLVNRLVFLMAILMAAFTLLVGSFRGLLLSSLGVFFLLLSWGPILLLFVFSQFSLRRIITKAKERTLNKIQKIIDGYAIEDKNSSGDKPASHDRLADIEYVTILLKFHDRVKSSRNTVLDFQVVVNLINSMLLPFLAFIILNYEKIKDFFSL